MDRHRDPDKIGHEWCAWWALQGDEPLECVAEAAHDLEKKLGLISAGMVNGAEAQSIASSARLMMIALAELLDPNGRSEFKAEIKRRQRGKPINRHERALRGHRSASIVIRLIDEGWKQEAAIAAATDETGLSRAEIMAWLAVDRATLGMPHGKMPE